MPLYCKFKDESDIAYENIRPLFVDFSIESVPLPSKVNGVGRPSNISYDTSKCQEIYCLDILKYTTI